MPLILTELSWKEKQVLNQYVRSQERRLNGRKGKEVKKGNNKGKCKGKLDEDEVFDANDFVRMVYLLLREGLYGVEEGGGDTRGQDVVVQTLQLDTSSSTLHDPTTTPPPSSFPTLYHNLHLLYTRYSFPKVPNPDHALLQPFQQTKISDKQQKQYSQQLQQIYMRLEELAMNVAGMLDDYFYDRAYEGLGEREQGEIEGRSDGRWFQRCVNPVFEIVEYVERHYLWDLWASSTHLSLSNPNYAHSDYIPRDKKTIDHLNIIELLYVNQLRQMLPEFYQRNTYVKKMIEDEGLLGRRERETGEGGRSLGEVKEKEKDKKQLKRQKQKEKHEKKGRSLKIQEKAQQKKRLKEKEREENKLKTNLKKEKKNKKQRLSKMHPQSILESSKHLQVESHQKMQLKEERENKSTQQLQELEVLEEQSSAQQQQIEETTSSQQQQQEAQQHFQQQIATNLLKLSLLQQKLSLHPSNLSSPPSLSPLPFSHLPSQQPTKQQLLQHYHTKQSINDFNYGVLQQQEHWIVANKKGYPSQVQRNRARNSEVLMYWEGEESGVMVSSGRRFLEVWKKVGGLVNRGVEEVLVSECGR